MRFVCKSRYIKVVITFFVMALALGAYGLPVSAAGTAILSVAAPTQPVSPGAQFTVNIMIQPNNAIAGAQFNLSFNPSLVTVNSVSEGNLLKQNGNNTFFIPGRIDNTAGTITGVAETITSPGQAVSTQGTFAVITMTAGSARGACLLTLSQVIVGDLQAQPVPVNTVGGNITIGNGANQPPVLNHIGNMSISAGSLLTFTVSATDPNGDSLTYSSANLPAGAVFNISSQVFSWTPAVSQVGTYSGVQFGVTDGIQSVSENITITVLSAALSGGGGGGGGGGGASASATPTPTTTNNGVFNQTSEVKSADGSAAVVIGQGTQGLTRDGKAISQVIVLAVQSPATPPAQSSIVGTVYNFGPDGATFNRPITLTLAYDPSLLPPGADPNSLVVATWDAASSQWVELKSTINPGSNTVTAQVNHFSIYCVIAHTPPPATVKIIPPAPTQVAPEPPTTAPVSTNSTAAVNMSLFITPSAVPESPATAAVSANLATTLAAAPSTPLSPPPAVTEFSLALLSEVIGGAFLLIAATIAIILLRRRRLLKAGRD